MALLQKQEIRYYSYQANYQIEQGQSLLAKIMGKKEGYPLVSMLENTKHILYCLSIGNLGLSIAVYFGLDC